MSESEGDVPIGVILDHRDGPSCIVLGELDEVHSSPAVPENIRSRIADQLDAGLDGHKGVKVHLFDDDGRAMDAMAIHWRNPRLFIDTADDGPDLDVCFGPNDTVFVSKGDSREPMTALRYSLPPTVAP